MNKENRNELLARLAACDSEAPNQHTRDCFAAAEWIKSLKQEVISADLYTLKAGRYGDTALEALKELVYLKETKDTHGKTEEYLNRQPKAWDRARSLLRGEF